MTILVHDSLAREKRPLVPLRSGELRLYVCGPTVYDDCHIGHLMGPVIFDAIARWLAARGHAVRFVNNITDIDDKIIRRAQETGEPWDSIARRYTERYFEHLRRLGVHSITDHPRCTEYIPQMVAFVAELIAKGRAYVASDGVYFDVPGQPGYGKLSGRRLEDLPPAVGALPEGVRHPADFALWKAAKPGEPTWESPWGPGRPGWHLECSVMASTLLGADFDVHGGGDDLKFPHHENEIAQSEGHGDGYARTWMHHGLVQYGGRKVAKSDPRMRDEDFARQFQASWLLEHWGPAAVRFFLLRGHYRRPIDFEPEGLRGAATGLARLQRQLGELLAEPGEAALGEILERALPAELAAERAEFCRVMDDDFRTGDAIGRLFAIAQVARGLQGGEERRAALVLLRDLGRILGLFRPEDALSESGEAGGALAEDAISLLLELRQEARARKDFALSDRIRDGLAAIGVRVLDGREGSSWERIEEGALP